MIDDYSPTDIRCIASWISRRKELTDEERGFLEKYGEVLGKWMAPY
jgi:hypothetical protein